MRGNESEIGKEGGRERKEREGGKEREGERERLRDTKW
jgi:hypothetical protein